MPKKFLLTYLMIVAVLLTMMSISRHTSDKMRGRSVAFMAPLWEKILTFKAFLLLPFQPSPFAHFTFEEEKKRLELENQLLATEISDLQKQIQEQLLVTSQIAQISSLKPKEAERLAREDEKSLQRILQNMQRRLKAIPARVIFRSFDTWNSSLWINVGASTNRDVSSPIIARNSPVMVGKAIVGILDYVGESQSRVRLISDTRLNPSVRASRGAEQDCLMQEQIERLVQSISHRQDLFSFSNDQTQLIQLLLQLKQKLQPFKKSWYLAKGELLGSPFSARLGQNVYLKGTGFNYDFADEEGDSRDLRNGKSMQHPDAQAIPILKVNDILITTGMDGIFPPGLQVAKVTRVELLKEGDYFYHLEAEPIASPLEELSVVFVLPPLLEEEIASKVK